MLFNSLWTEFDVVTFNILCFLGLLFDYYAVLRLANRKPKRKAHADRKAGVIRRRRRRRRRVQKKKCLFTSPCNDVSSEDKG